MKIIDCEQGTPEWLKARAGLVTASNIPKVLAGKETAKRRDYIYQIVAEILTGEPADEGYVSEDMKRGREQEQFACAAYEIKFAQFVEKIGFVVHDELRTGASPDRLVGDDGLVEAKCPKTSTHCRYIFKGEVPTEYKPQMLWQMFVTDRKWCDFVSFDSRLDEKNQLFVIRFERDDAEIERIVKEVKTFLGEVYEIVKKLKERS